MNKSFQSSIGPIIAFGQFFAMLPISNVTSEKEETLHFRWFSFKTIYAMTFLVFGTIESCLATRRIIVIGFTIIYVETILFFTVSMLKAFMVFRLATKWKDIMKQWSIYENAFLGDHYKIKGWSLKTRLSTLFIVMVCGVFVEHLLFLAYAINNNFLQLTYCNPKSKIFWDNYLSRYRPHIRYFIKYSPYQLPLYEWVNLLQAFAFSYTDIFIMLLAVGITTRFNQYSQLLRKVIYGRREMKGIMWRDLRLHYINLVELTKFIDKHISGLVLISTAHNMLTLILKFYNAFKPTNLDVLNTVYFWFFLIFLTARTFSVLFLAASINEAAVKPLQYIRNIPSSEWNVEAKRLFDMIMNEASTIGFSGKQLFYITRGLMLSMVGTIITFEIILLDQVPPSPENLCDFID